MTAERSGRSKFAELVTYHVFSHIYGNELVTVVNRYGMTHEIG